MLHLPNVILIATRNPGKVREIRHILAEFPVRWESLDAFPHVAEPDETGAAFADNARLKALWYAEHCRVWALADDSGLEVDALGGAPGVYSARYAGLQQDDAANNARLIRELAAVPDAQRTARFRCAIALAAVAPVRVVAEADGAIEGRIIDVPRGRNGFGYDPHFLVPELGLTTAELDPADKPFLRPRGRALRALVARLRQLSPQHRPL